MEHLSGSHSGEQSLGGCEDLFEQCINNSLYLPEPDEQLPAEDKQFVNLPPELSSTAVNTSSTTDAEGTETPAAVPADSSSVMEASSTLPGAREGEEEGMEQGGADSDVVEQGEVALNNPVKREMMDLDMGSDRITVMVNEEGVTDILPSTAAATTTTTKPEAEAPKGDNPTMEGSQEGGDNLAAPGDMQPATEDTPSQTTSELTGPLASSDVPLAPNPGQPCNEEEDFEALENAEDLVEESQGGEEDGAEMDPESETASDKGDKKENKKNIVEWLGFHKMNMQIFQKMRETFGSEECEYCGRLFYTKQDYEPHLRTHTGKQCLPRDHNFLISSVLFWGPLEFTPVPWNYWK